ncbi:hypothetical protein BS78_K165900 [Paspalum vaginatum]|uniref:Uncharacterized protein n=1 Tax=Paspalum vaginatum TaxID=158149 RepID=A0A9W7XBZ5_9POAL|nr:hypothetical protein BS78_K165900 [Paspalum vaginatum]
MASAEANNCFHFTTTRRLLLICFIMLLVLASFIAGDNSGPRGPRGGSGSLDPTRGVRGPSCCQSVPGCC